jgi:aspartyl-tRNA(Asn)/glutamyl-tRNA(Gln) amidotransferase subunit C
MAVTIDHARIVHIAKLAGLSLSEEEIYSLSGDLNRIVLYFELLDELDTEDVPPTTTVQLRPTSLRADEVREGLSHQDALRGAPQVEDDGFAVPTFVE